MVTSMAVSSAEVANCGLPKETDFLRVFFPWGTFLAVAAFVDSKKNSNPGTGLKISNASMSMLTLLF